MAITITVEEINNNVVLEQSDTPITVSTTLDLVTIGGLASDITVEAPNTVPSGSLQNAINILADQFFRGANAPSGSNLEEGDLWYDTDDDQLKVYRETSTNVFEFVPLAAATDTMDNLDGGQF